MIEKRVRVGSVADQDRFRRDDLQAMTPDERLAQLIRMRDIQFGATARPIRERCVCSTRQLTTANHAEPT